MATLINALKKIEGEQVSIHTEHKLFGSQNICIKFKPETETGVGFHCKDQVIYMDKDDIVGYDIIDNEILINGSLMYMRITVVD